MAATDTEKPFRVESPCLRLCTLDDDDICVGCFRSIGEICAWGGASNRQREQILERAAARGRKRQSV